MSAGHANVGMVCLDGACQGLFDYTRIQVEESAAVNVEVGCVGLLSATRSLIDKQLASEQTIGEATQQIRALFRAEFRARRADRS